MKLLNVTPLTDAGNVRALVEIETPNGETIQAKIVKQEGFRAYLVSPEGITFTHKEKRILQRQAVTAWAEQISDTLGGLLLSEKVYKGSRMNHLHVQLKAFCPICDRVTLTEVSETPGGHFRNACFFCSTLRKGRPFISRAEAEQIKEKIDRLNANTRKSKRGTDEAEAV